jgi:UDP-glucose 4-epimerase
LLDACRDAGVGMVVFPSSGGTVYGMAGGAEPFTEDASTEPVSSYGITKLTIEKYLALYRHMHGIDYRILRISNAYGEGQQPDRPQGLIGVVLQRLMVGRGITVWGDGSTVRDYVYAADVADAFVRAGRSQLRPEESRIFNIGSGEGHSVRQVLSLIEEVTGQRPEVTYAPARACDVARAVLSSRRAGAVLGWSSQVSLREGIERTSKWVSSTVGGSEER